MIAVVDFYFFPGVLGLSLVRIDENYNIVKRSESIYQSNVLPGDIEFKFSPGFISLCEEFKNFSEAKDQYIWVNDFRFVQFRKSAVIHLPFELYAKSKVLPADFYLSNKFPPRLDQIVAQLRKTGMSSTELFTKLHRGSAMHTM